MTLDLSRFDIILANTSGGKDSQVMLDYLVELADAAGVRDRIVAVHADLGRVEWEGTKELAELQAKTYGLRFLVTSRSQGDLLTHIEQRGKFPDSANRYCTSDHKTSQVLRVITALVDELRNKAGYVRNPDGTFERRKVRILNCLGMRAQESPNRAKLPVLSIDKAHWGKPPSKKRGTTGVPHGKREVQRWLPIHDWTEDEVWARIKESGVPHHPAYDQGMPRLSCSFCVLASTGALVRAAQLRPALAAEYARVELLIDHRFRNDLSMAKIIELAATTDTSPIENWAA